MQFTIPGKPEPQLRPRAVRMGNGIRMYDPKKTKDYKIFVSFIAKQHAPKILLEGALFVELKIYRQIPKRTSKKDRALMFEGIKRPITKPDTDNYTKAILDACNGIIYKDDSQVVKLIAHKYYSDDPRVEITVEEMWEESFHENKICHKRVSRER